MWIKISCFSIKFNAAAINEDNSVNGKYFSWIYIRFANIKFKFYSVIITFNSDFSRNKSFFTSFFSSHNYLIIRSEYFSKVSDESNVINDKLVVDNDNKMVEEIIVPEVTNDKKKVEVSGIIEAANDMPSAGSY